jgi:hypothetical protein
MLEHSDDTDLIWIWDHGYDWEYFVHRGVEAINDLIDDGMFED